MAEIEHKKLEALKKIAHELKRSNDLKEIELKIKLIDGYVYEDFERDLRKW